MHNTRRSSPAFLRLLTSVVASIAAACSTHLEVPVGKAGPLTEVPLLSPNDPKRPFNHSAETAIAARDGHVAVISINLHLEMMTTPGENTAWRHAGLAVSHDGGITFGPAKYVGLGEQPTDPLVRVDANGRFWLSTWDWTSRNNVGSLQISDDSAQTWTTLIANIPIIDKEWFAFDDVSRTLYMAAVGGFWKFGYDGALRAFARGRAFTTGAYADEHGAHFSVNNGTDTEVLFWDGKAAPSANGEALSGGADANLRTSSSKGFGKSPSGGYWILRGTKEGSTAQVILRVRNLPDSDSGDIALSHPNTVAFMPAGTLDNQGRLHAIWYESSGPTGVLVYTRSVTSNFSEGFTKTLVVDPHACPGDGWYPGPAMDDANDRRLREYIDIAVDGNRAHLAWTHSPELPSRVYTTYIDFD